MVRAIREVQSFVSGMDLAAFAADAKTLKAVLANFAVIGEAARHIPDDVASKYVHVPWRDMCEMRNFVVHVCFGVEPSIVWNTIQRDLPFLASELEKIIAEAPA